MFSTCHPTSARFPSEPHTDQHMRGARAKTRWNPPTQPSPHCSGTPCALCPTAGPAAKNNRTQTPPHLAALATANCISHITLHHSGPALLQVPIIGSSFWPIISTAPSLCPLFIPFSSAAPLLSLSMDQCSLSILSLFCYSKERERKRQTERVCESARKSLRVLDRGYCTEKETKSSLARAFSFHSLPAHPLLSWCRVYSQRPGPIVQTSLVLLCSRFDLYCHNAASIGPVCTIFPSFPFNSSFTTGSDPTLLAHLQICLVARRDLKSLPPFRQCAHPCRPYFYTTLLSHDALHSSSSHQLQHHTIGSMPCTCHLTTMKVISQP